MLKRRRRWAPISGGLSEAVNDRRPIGVLSNNAFLSDEINSRARRVATVGSGRFAGGFAAGIIPLCTGGQVLLGVDNKITGNHMNVLLGVEADGTTPVFGDPDIFSAGRAVPRLRARCIGG